MFRRSRPLLIAPLLLALAARPVSAAPADSFERTDDVASTALQFRADPSLPSASADRLCAALTVELRRIAPVECHASAEMDRPMARISAELTAGGLVLRFTAADGQALGAPRVVPGPIGEVSTSEAATIAYAFVVALQEGAPGSIEELRATAPIAQVESTGTPETPPEIAELPEREQTRDDANLASASPFAGAARDVVPHSRQRPWRVRLFAAYTGVNEAPQLPWHSGVRGELAVRVTRGLYLGAGYVYFAPSTVEASAATVVLRAHGLSGFAGYGASFRHFGVAGDLGLSAANSLRETLKADKRVATADQHRWDSYLALRLHGLIRVRALPRLTFEVVPALELALSRHRLAVGDAGETTMLSPQLLRPRIDLGASFDVL